MFDITAKLVGEQDEISNVDKIHWEKHSWKHLSLIGDETLINLQRAKVYVFSDSVLCLRRVHEHPQSNKAWKERIGWIVTDKSQKLSHEEFYLCRCSTTFPVTGKTMKKNVWQMPKSSPYLQGSLVLDSGHFLVQVPKKKWYSMEENSPQGI